MWRKLVTLFLVTALAGAAPTARNMPLVERVEGLRSEDADVRQAAQETIVHDYDETVAALERVIQQNLGGKDWGQIRGELAHKVSRGEPVPAKYPSAASAMRVLGELRAVRSVPLLVRYLGFRPSWSVVHDHPPVLEEYPAAWALASIGTPSLEQVVEACKERPDTRVLVYLTLERVLGPRLLKEYVRNAIAAERSPEKRDRLRVLLPQPREGAQEKAVNAIRGLGGQIIMGAELPGCLVDLGDTKITDAGLKELKELKSLQGLDLRGTNITDAGLKELKELQRLRWLDLGGTNITDVGLKELKELKGLLELNLRGTKITDAGLKELKELQGLRWLDLGGTRVTNAGLKELKELEGLLELNLRGTKITDAGLKELKELQGLQRLYLADTNVTGDGLKDLKGLEELDLGGTKITDAGLKELKELQGLQGLGLHGTNITDAGLKELKELQELRWLDPFGIKVTGDGVNDLRQALPNIRIFSR